MNIFYAANAAINTPITLNETEAHHAFHVLRMKQGDSINVFDGIGNLYNGTIAHADKKNTVIQLGSLISAQSQTNQLHIAIAPTKQMERIEWFIEKAVEIGIGEITPVICSRSERKEFKTERLEKLILSACKQSKQYYLPKLNPLIKFNDFINSNLPAIRCIAWCETTTTAHIKSIIQAAHPLVCLIGPEGDFTKEEATLATEKRFTPVSLGNSILRSETAGVYVTAIYQGLTL